MSHQSDPRHPATKLTNANLVSCTRAMAVAGGFPGGSVGPGHSSHAELANLRARLAQASWLGRCRKDVFFVDNKMMCILDVM